MTKESLIEKVQKLLAKANGEGTTPQESAAFLAKAKKMMTEHRIEQHSLDSVFTDNENPLDESGRMATWKCQLAMNLSIHNGCFIVRSKGGRKTSLVLTGKAENMGLVKALYSYCVAEIDRLTKKLAYNQGKVYTNNFRLGCVEAINDAIIEEVKRQKEYYQNNERALVVINQTPIDLEEAREYAQNNMRLRRGQGSRFRHDSSGRNAGYNAGSSIYGGFGTNRIGN